MPDTDVLIQRAHLLLSQGRSEDAVKQLSEVLHADPNNDHALSLMGRARFDQQRYKEGMDLIQRAISQEPTESYYYYLLAFGYYNLENNPHAQLNIRKAIELHPYQPDYFGLWAILLLEKNQFSEALERANEGLALDPENVSCLNARATALNKLNRTDESIDTMKTVLDADPENYYTHVNVGWNLLEKGRQREATTHFREALRLNPRAEAARAGLKQSLKSNIPPYKWLLQYSFWLNNKGSVARWAIPVGIYFGVRAVDYLSRTASPAVATAGMIIVGLYIILALGSWFINPLANLFLFFHKDGKYALTSGEKWGAVLTVSALVTGLASLGIYFFLSDGVTDFWLVAGILAISLALPLSVLEFPIQLSFRNVALKQLLAMAALLIGLIWIALFFTGSLTPALFQIYIYIIIAFTWGAALSR